VTELPSSDVFQRIILWLVLTK